MNILFAPVSGNKKTGPIPVSYSPSNTCPDSCPLKSGGCYAKNGPVRTHWNRLDEGKVGIKWNDFLSSVRKIWKGSLWRWGVAGDLPGQGERIDAKMLSDLVKANRGKRGWGYTHKPVIFGPHAKTNRAAIAEANKNGFTINLSGNNLHHADTLAALGIGPVVSVVPESQVKNTVTPAGRRVVICPASIRDEATCARCGLCANPKREYIIAFPSHGTQKKKAEAVFASGCQS